jgi:AraC-like DNA-binding protein
MNTNNTLNYRLYVQRQEEFVRDDYRAEFRQYNKIKTAENMFRYSDASILDIALSLGFSSQSAFSSSFRKITQMTPKAYRDEFYSYNMVK